uniref:Uncharacterized protein n=1 Tax=Brassica oleracea var. oleracea TaxID=109376 RepID=A0A0D3AQT3_BRAOL
MYGWRITEYLNRFCGAVSYEDSFMLCRLLSLSSRMILKYLIPVKLSLGILPNDKLLPKYNLHEYMNVVQALRKGDLRLRQHSSSRTRRSCIVAVFTAQQWLVSYRANRLNESRDALVTYMCYTGRFEVFNESFPAGESLIDFLWMILKYLIPVKLSLGILPNDKLLPKYNLHEYMNVVQALRKGDLRLRQHSSSRTRRSCIVAVFTAQQWLVSYRANRLNESRDALITEQLDINQVLEVRCLGKAGTPSLPETHEENLSDPARGHQLKLEVIAKALGWLEIDMDLDVMPVRINHGIEKNRQ